MRAPTTTAALYAATSLLLLLVVQPAGALWPVPRNASLGSDVLWIAPTVRVQHSVPQQQQGAPRSYGADTRVADENDEAGASDAEVFGEQIVRTAVGNMYRTIFAGGYVPWKFHPRNSAFEPPVDGNRKYIRSIALVQNASTPANISKPLGSRAALADEAYALALTPDGRATITAASPLGLAHGLTTFAQLFYAHSRGGAYTPYAPAAIADRPVFPHRGLNMDVARNYYPLPDVLRTIDALAAVKLNRLHLHVTDAQAWPLAVPSMPELASAGAYTPGAVYTPAALRAIQRFGALRGVQVYIETDMPGHTSSLAFSHPELIAAFNRQPDWDSFCAEPPCGTLKLNDSRVPAFLDKLFADVLPRVAEFAQYYHTGGDEVNFNAYSLDDSVRSNASATVQPLLQRFFDATHAAVAHRAGLVQVVWEEMLLTYNLTLPKDVVVQSWLADESVARIVAAGHRAIAGNYNYWYLDCGHGAWTNYVPGAASQAAFPYQDYCAPLHNWRVMYAYDPLGSVPADKHELVLGGEASIWAEQTDGVSIDSVIWPRLGAAAEVLWAGAKDPVTGANRSQIEAAPRLSDLRERLVARGVRAATVQMPFCTQNGSQCALDH